MMTVKSRPANSSDFIVVGGRSHQLDDCKFLIEGLSDAQMPLIGSSLKLCFIAEGKAGLHLSLGPTSEWYAVSLQAIVEAAVGQTMRRYFVTASMNIVSSSLYH